MDFVIGLVNAVLNLPDGLLKVFFLLGGGGGGGGRPYTGYDIKKSG